MALAQATTCGSRRAFRTENRRVWRVSTTTPAPVRPRVAARAQGRRRPRLIQLTIPEIDSNTST